MLATEPGAIIGVCFHGVGEPGFVSEPGAADYFIGKDEFLRILDEVIKHPEVDLSFDDGYASDIDIALPALLERDLSARFFPIAGHLGSAGHTDSAGLAALVAAGMRIGSHGMHHRSWRKLDAATSHEEFEEARQQIEFAAGTPVDTAACPFGLYDRRALRQLKGAGYAAVFTSDRRRARPGAWLQPRYSVLRTDTVVTVRTAILQPRPLHERARNAFAGRVKAWR